MKRRRGGVRPCKGQLELWRDLAELARYKRDSIPTEKIKPLLDFLLKRYSSYERAAEVVGVRAHLLRSWHQGHVTAVDREHAIHLTDVVLAHRKPKQLFSADSDVVRRLPTTAEADETHRDQQRAWRAYYRARARGEDVQPPGEKDTSRTRRGRKAAAR